MTVRIRFKGPLASQIPRNIIEVQVSNEIRTLNDILGILLGEYPEAGAIWESAEQMDTDALLLKNGVDIGLLDGLDTVLNDNDEIIVLPLVHGG